MRQKHLTFSIVFLVLLCSFIALVAISQQKSLLQLTNEMKEKSDALYLPPNGAWPRYERSFNHLERMIDEVRNAIRGLGGISLSPQTTPGEQVVEAIDVIVETSGLSQEIRDGLNNIETQRAIVENLWLDVDDAWVAYYEAVGHYNYAVSPEERIGITEPTKLVATELYFCQGPCDVLFETPSLARLSHQTYCSEKHGTSGATGVTYWSCNGNTTCDRSDEHWRLCGGSCGQTFAPKKISRGQGNYDWVANSPHSVTCSESVYSFLNPIAKCGEKYYTCEHSSCPESNRHWSSNENSPENNICPKCGKAH